MAGIARQGANTIRAHLAHLDAHGEKELLKTGAGFSAESETRVPRRSPQERRAPRSGRGPTGGASCRHDGHPSGRRRHLPRSHLGNWPIQLHLLSPMAPQFKGKDVLLSADCVAYAVR